MRIDKKIYWRISNYLEARYRQFRGGKGFLRSRRDIRDDNFKYEDRPEFKKEFDEKKIGVGLQEKFSRFKFYYDQNPHNDCVFASGTIGYSEQEGIRMSVKWIVKNARRLGKITGNGWSYLRAMPDVALKIGLLPYELMPDEVNPNWEEYSKWTPEDEKLLEEAAKYKIKDYRWITTRQGLIDAITNDYVPLTAGKWFSGMNHPQPPAYLLQYIGQYLGGHAWRLTGWSYFAKYIESPQTFGRWYGDNTKAWLETPFSSSQYGIYVMAKLPLETKIEHFKRFYNGKIVRTKDDSTCYYIEDGLKRHIPTIEIFWELIERAKTRAEMFPYDSETNIGISRCFDDDVNPEVLNTITKGEDVLHLN